MLEAQESVDSKVLKIESGRTVLSSKCTLCNSKKWKFMKEQEVKGILSSLKTSLDKIPLLSKILF